jgi:SOS-response transcriptional repressor LexA
VLSQCVSYRSMARTPDDRRELLRRFITENKLKVARWAKESGVSQNSVYNFLNGHSDALEHLTYAKLARTAEVPVWRLSGDDPEPPSPTTVWLSGYVEAGAWKEAVELDPSEWRSVDVPVPSRFQGRARALGVRGTSMNIDYPDGSVAIWVPMLDFRPPQDGDDVVVYSFRDDAQVEATLKRYREVNGEKWLWPHSTDPLHQAPINTRDPGEGIREISIMGIVIGSYRPKVL